MRREDLCPAELPVLLIPTEAISVPENRLRSLKADQARAIGQAILADGQYDPITVAQLPGQDGFVLVDGLHRLEGCRDAGIALIEARIGTPDRDARRRQEILSGWARADEDVFDRAAQIAAMAELAQTSTGQAIENSPETNPRGYADEASLMMRLSLNWPEATAEALGISRPQVFRHLQVRRAFDADAVSLLRRLNLAMQLMPLVSLAKLPPESLDAALKALRQGRVLTIADAIELALNITPPNPVTKATDALFRKASSWSPRDRASFIIEWNRQYHADGRKKAAE